MGRAPAYVLPQGEALLPLRAHGVKLMSMGFINPGVMPLRGAKVRMAAQTLQTLTRLPVATWSVCTPYSPAPRAPVWGARRP